MKILYLTTARHPKDYANFLADNKTAPNPSNQNFHTKFINLLASSFELKVISTRPMEKSFFIKEERNDIYYYPGFINNVLLRRKSLIYPTIKEAKRFAPDIIFVDILNITLLSLAHKISKSLNIKVVGIITDNPFNITGTKKKYSENVFKLSRNCDGFLGLTSGLLELFKVTEKPHLVVPGFINTKANNGEIHEDYAFFAGALYERYGVKNIIEAFKNEKMPLKLTIAGHGPLAEDLRRNYHPNIEFIGHVSPEVAFHLAQKAKILINPRPLDPQIDLYSVPSKVLDYINSETVTISTLNEEIKKLVGNTICWLNDNETETIVKAVRDVLKDYDFWKVRALSAKKALVAAIDETITLDRIRNLIQRL